MGQAHRVPGRGRLPTGDRSDEGAAAVEFALVLPLLLLLLFGTFVVGWSLWEHQGASSTAGTAARLAALGLDDAQFDDFPGRVASLAACDGVGQQLQTIELAYSDDPAGTQAYGTGTDGTHFVTVSLTFRSALAGLPLYVPVIEQYTVRRTQLMETVRPGDHTDDVTLGAPAGVTCP